jgi:DNA-binding GntR family transcriptional regulator
MADSATGPVFSTVDEDALRTRSRAEFVYERLRDAISDGRIAAGERVREEEVARNLGVSRTPVREALSRLQSRGLLEMANGGLVVTRLTRPQIIELYAMREILEGSAARFAAQHASPSEIASLKHIAGKFERELGDAPRLARANRELHEGIYEAAHNRYLLRTLNELHDALALLPNTTFAYEGRAEKAIREHAGIISAIEKRNADRAEQLARQHIRMAQEARLAMMFDEA